MLEALEALVALGFVSGLLKFVDVEAAVAAVPNIEIGPSRLNYYS